MDLMFRGQIPEGVDPRDAHEGRAAASRVPGPRRARSRSWTSRASKRCSCSRRSACGIEQALRDDIPATMATLRAFNRWLDEDWGFSYQDRIVTRADAVARRSRRRARGARLAARARRAHRAPAPRAGPDRERPRAVARRPRSTTRCGRAWPRRRSRSRSTSATAGTRCSPGRGAPATTSSRSAAASTCSSKLVVSDRPIHDTHRQHDRRRRVPPPPRPAGRRASRTAPTGCTLLAKRLTKQANQTPWVFPESPLETIRAHVWVTPYYEEDMRKLADLDRRRARALRLRLAARRGPRRTRSTSSRSSTPSPTTRSARSCATTPSSCSAPEPPRDRRRNRVPTDDDDRLLAEVDRVARRELGSRPHRRASGGAASAHAGWTAPHFPRRVGRSRLSRALGRRVRARRSTTPVRCCRPAASGCSWPRPRSSPHGTPEQIDRLVPPIYDGSVGVVPAVQRAGRGLRSRRPHDPRRRATATTG